MMKWSVSKIVLLSIILNLNAGWGQDYSFSLGLWKIQSVKGFLELQGLYRSEENILKKGSKEQINTSNLLGKIYLRSKSFIWHPNLLLLDMNFSYQPIRRMEDFLVFPDRTETRIVEKAFIQGTLFKSTPLRLSGFINYHHDLVNREYLTDVETFRRDMGGSVRLLTEQLPILIKFQREKWDQRELQTNRIFQSLRERFLVEISKTFSGLDNHLFRYSHEYYSRNYTGFGSVINRIHSINLDSRWRFKSFQESIFQSLIWFYLQEGNNNFDRLQIYERLYLDLPVNFKFSSNYQYSYFQQAPLQYSQHSVSSRLLHQLYLSLQSQIFFNYFALNQSAFQERIPSMGVSFNYQKRIPTGRLFADFEYRRRHENRQGSPVLLQIIDEQITLKDEQTTLLKNPFVDPKSIVVTDETGTIIYQENIDYIPIPRGNYIEIQRIPGGQIENGMTVYVDYTVRQPVDYRYDTFNRNWGVGINLFNHFLEFYYRRFEQDHANIHTNDLRILQYITQDVYGGQLSTGFFTAGMEIDNFQSNIVPYYLKRYFLSVFGNVSNKLELFVSGNYRDYRLTERNEKQLLTDISGKLHYRLWYRASLNLSGSFRVHEGREIDLNLATGRCELQIRHRQLQYFLGYEFYRRDFIGEKSSFNGFYLRIRRDF